MSGLGDTLAGLAAIKKSLGAGLAVGGGGDAGMTEVRGFGLNPGALRMLTHIPADLPRGAPLVVVLHGCTQSAGAYAAAAGWLTLADRLEFAVLAPEQTAANNPNRCFNWFEPGDTARGGGEAASIHAMIWHIIGAHGLDPKRVFVTGLSAGGAMTASMLAAYPEIFAAGAVIAGLPAGAADSVQEAFMAMHNPATQTGAQLKALVTKAAPAPKRWPRLSIWHGASDHTVAVANADALARQWTAVHGLSAQPDSVATAGRVTHSRWPGADGTVLVESHIVSGLGHGTPIAAGGADPVGHTAPFVLEAGIASSLEIARFWGIAPAQAEVRTRPRAKAAPPQPTRKSGVGDSVMHAVSGHVSADVGAVIAKALKAAGLMS
jgi:poly(hydroxyalkanoate) depolymerase family esterase